MRLSLPLLVPALACLAQADSGKLYIYDSNVQSTRPAEPTTVSPETARLIIASRLGLDQFHSLGSVNEDTLAAINQLSGSQHLFSDASSEAPVALILGEGLNQREALATSGSHHVQTVQIDDIPSVASTRKLFVDLATQSRVHGGHNKADHLRDQLSASPAGPAFKIARDQDDFVSTLDTLLRQDYTVLALAVPNDTTSKHSYGQYDTVSKHASHHKRTQFKEAPLITESRPAQEPKLEATLSPSVGTSDTTPLKGILPQCFASKQACESQTRNCTGHGACTLKYTDKDARPEASCYSCSCSPTVVTNKDGSKKTTKWGGPACQKKDIVMPFWLLAGFSVFMISLVSWAIGMLLTMGNEELPSVIGAGVSGVPRHK